MNPGKPQDGYAIHVKGKSGLKQTRVVLSAWAQHPEWPPLVVVGKVSDEELTPPARVATNIVYFPPITAAGQEQAASSEAMLIDAARLRDIQGAATWHICPSVREGFGHYLNEARAVGALVVTTNHPPMNELVQPETGLLVTTSFTKSEPGTELARLTHINGHISAEDLVAVVGKAVAMAPQERERMRAAARAAYVSEKAAFVHRMQQLKAFLTARAQKHQQT